MFGTHSQWDHAYHKEKEPFKWHYLIIISLKLTKVTSYFNTKNPSWAEYEDQNKLKIKLMAKAPPWNPSSPDFSRQEQNMLNYRGWFVIPNTSPRGQLFIKSVTLYAYNAADVMDDDKIVTMLEIFVNTLPLWVAQVNTKNVSWLFHLILTKKWGISLDKAFNTNHCITQQGIHTVLPPSLFRQCRTNDHWLWYRGVPHNVYNDTLLFNTVSRIDN